MVDLPLPAERPLQQLGRADLGAFTAKVLFDPSSYIGQRIELASDAPTPLGMAAALGAALGREVRHERLPLGAVTNPDMHAMWAFLNGPGYRVDILSLHGVHPDISWTRYSDWAERVWAVAR
ncbi:NmrA family NAD(P)-binding protein [Streptomyces rubrogriseus]|uniref:NmrA family NAD(P)-binding protein n=1 Tax=Streptomyces rubrogriseus TaxID=194673 RepID=UPI0036B58840